MPPFITESIAWIKAFLEKHEVIAGLLSKAWVFGLGLAFAWMRQNIFIYLRAKRWIVRYLTRKKYVLVWNDDDVAVSKRLIGRLKSDHPKFRFKILKEPDKLLYFPADHRAVHAIILIVSDVTKLADREKRRKLVQEHLLAYLEKGGVLVGTHDIIYRRCRNELLEKLYGCQINQFQRLESALPVSQVPENAGHPLLAGLPASFTLKDGEVCWGEWPPSAQVLLRTTITYEGRELTLPVLVYKESGHDGIAIWMNSADKTREVAPSVSAPAKEFVKVLSNALSLRP